MNGTNENKVDSLIAELRSFGDRPTPRFAWNRIADELESAVKEEREELREAASSKMLEGATIIDNRGHGNAAVMHEALETIHDKVNGLDEECGVDPVEIRDLARAALSAPPRNCDIGTEEDQAQRFGDFCLMHQRELKVGEGLVPYSVCLGCKVNELTEKQHGQFRDCSLTWAQMPYEEGGDK